jgi:uncharacterized membrane protein YbjE (DUF340 family)
MAIDPFLYVALGAGFAVGRFSPYHGRWIGWATGATIVLLVFLLGTVLGASPLGALLGAVPIGIAFVAAILLTTLAVDRLLAGRGAAGAVRRAPPAPGGASPYEFPVALLAALLVGTYAGHAGAASVGSALPYALYALLALVGYDLNLVFPSPRSVLAPVAAALAGAALGGSFALLLLGLPVRVAFATAFGFGWYTLTGPLVVRAAGPTLGLVAFVTNFLRENLTMLSAPWAGPRVGGEGLVAMGGAASMDTTLYFVTRYGDPRAGAVALSSGLLLTVLASLLVPLILGLPG